MAIDYESAGVRYDELDAFKRACQRQAATTVGALSEHQLAEPKGIRGESAYLVEAADEYLAHVEEGLGTKNLIADEMQNLTGRCHYRGIGIDTVATIVNDLITTGALPISVAMHAAVGDSEWFQDHIRAEELAHGFADGCREACAVWGGGETPALKDIVNPRSIVLAGSAIGRIKPKSHRISAEIRAGDAIVMLASSGVHTNGLTLCRVIANQLPQGYLTKLNDSRSFGDALLDPPSVIYVKFISACQRAGLNLHYAVHITGHGWRKLMRAEEPFVYHITTVRPPPEIFRFLMAHGVQEREAYATFNMGAGFAVYVDRADAEQCMRLAAQTGCDAWLAGIVEKSGSRKAVEIEALGMTFDSETLQVR